MVDTDHTRIASIVQRLPGRVSPSEWKLVLATEWHFRLVDRLKAYPPARTTVGAWLSLHKQTLHSAHVVREKMQAQGDPWTECIPNLTHLIVRLKEEIAFLKRLDARRIIPAQAAGCR
jgi:hypothetical protein